MSSSPSLTSGAELTTRRDPSPGAPLPCDGAPRDLGLSQGRRLAGPIRDRLAREGLRVARPWPWPRRFSGGASLGAGMGREVVRHYPHLAERMAGVAIGARIPIDPLMELHVLSGYEPDRLLPGALTSDGRPLLIAVNRGGRVQILRRFAAVEAPGARWGTRRSRPEVGFASLEVLQPWCVSGVAGVNEAGLAVTLGARCEAPRSDSALAPSYLLVQECLQRFDEIDGALEWCEKRPAQSGVSLVLGDEAGRLALVELRSDGVHVTEPAHGIAVLGADAEGEAQVRESLDAGAEIEPAMVGEAPGTLHVWIEPAARELQLRPARGDR